MAIRQCADLIISNLHASHRDEKIDLFTGKRLAVALFANDVLWSQAAFLSSLQSYDPSLVIKTAAWAMTARPWPNAVESFAVFALTLTQPNLRTELQRDSVEWKAYTV